MSYNRALADRFRQLSINKSEMIQMFSKSKDHTAEEKMDYDQVLSIIDMMLECSIKALQR